MRLALFTETFLPKVDGIVNTLCHLLDDLYLQGHESLLFAPVGGPGQYADTPVIGIPGMPFPLYPELTLASPLARVSQPLERFQPDVIHLFNPALLGIAGLRAARQLRVPVVASYHTDIPGFAARWGLGFLQRPIWAYFRWIHNQVDLNLTPSSFTRREIEAKGFRRVAVWPHGVDAKLFSPRKRSQTWRWRLSAGNPEKTLLLYVGRIAKEKRIDWLLPVLQANPDLRLAIVGDGPALTDLKERFRGAPTVFTGYLHGEDLAQAYASADIFAFPGANETFGNVVLEAMSSGLAVVAPNAGGVLDFVENGKNGLLFAAESQGALVDAVRFLIENREIAMQLALAGRAKAQEMSWQSVDQALLDNYQALVSRRASQYDFVSPEASWMAKLST